MDSKEFVGRVGRWALQLPHRLYLKLDLSLLLRLLERRSMDSGTRIVEYSSFGFRFPRVGRK